MSNKKNNYKKLHSKFNFLKNAQESFGPFLLNKNLLKNKNLYSEYKLLFLSYKRYFFFIFKKDFHFRHSFFFKNKFVNFKGSNPTYKVNKFFLYRKEWFFIISFSFIRNFKRYLRFLKYFKRNFIKKKLSKKLKKNNKTFLRLFLNRYKKFIFFKKLILILDKEKNFYIKKRVFNKYNKNKRKKRYKKIRNSKFLGFFNYCTFKLKKKFRTFFNFSFLFFYDFNLILRKRKPSFSFKYKKKNLFFISLKERKFLNKKKIFLYFFFKRSFFNVLKKNSFKKKIYSSFNFNDKKNFSDFKKSLISFYDKILYDKIYLKKKFFFEPKTKKKKKPENKFLKLLASQRIEYPRIRLKAGGIHPLDLKIPPKFSNKKLSLRPVFFPFTVSRHRLSRFKFKLLQIKRFKFFFGGFSMKQLKKLCLKALKLKKDAINFFLIFLESRLDVSVFRLGFHNSIFEVKQDILHGRIFVNGFCKTFYSFELKNLDIITFDKYLKNFFFQKNLNLNLKRKKSFKLKISKKFNLKFLENFFNYFFEKKNNSSFFRLFIFYSKIKIFKINLRKILSFKYFFFNYFFFRKKFFFEFIKDFYSVSPYLKKKNIYRLADSDEIDFFINILLKKMKKKKSLFFK